MVLVTSFGISTPPPAAPVTVLYLASEVLGEMMEHLNQCVDCQQAFEFHAELRAVVKKAAGDEPLPDSLLGRIKQCFGTDLTVDTDQA